MTRTRTKRPEKLLIERGILLNFWITPFWLPHPLTDELFCYPGVEWRFQSYKSLFIHGLRFNERIVLHDMIASSTRARGAADQGRSVQGLNVAKWNRYSYNVMLLANLAKFTQHEGAKQALLNTGNKILIEHRRDPIWGDGMDGSGKDQQGEILRKVRAVLK